MRNVEKIKQLKHEIGRQDKKIADQERELAKLRKSLENARTWSQQTQAAIDGILTAVVMTHGVETQDSDNPGVLFEKQLEVPIFSVKDMLKRYEIHAQRNEKAGIYVLRISHRKEV